jgi:hypothetical protein
MTMATKAKPRKKWWERDISKCWECGTELLWARDLDTDEARPLDRPLTMGLGGLYCYDGRTCWTLVKTGLGHADHRDTCPKRAIPIRPSGAHPAIPE